MQRPLTIKVFCVLELLKKRLYKFKLIYEKKIFLIQVKLFLYHKVSLIPKTTSQIWFSSEQYLFWSWTYLQLDKTSLSQPATTLSLTHHSFSQGYCIRGTRLTQKADFVWFRFDITQWPATHMFTCTLCLHLFVVAFKTYVPILCSWHLGQCLTTHQLFSCLLGETGDVSTLFL